MTIRRVLLGLGSNVGDRLLHLRRAVRGLGKAASRELCLIAISPIYESDALLPDGASVEWNRPYLNLAVLAETGLEPLDLLRWIKAAEVALGRRPAVRWSPREIDIDLLAIDGLTLNGPTLTLPHRDLLRRPFVLLPVADLVPEWALPDEDGGSTQQAGEWAERWRCEPDAVPFRTRRIPASLTELVGILNLTPDSFSDGGRWLDPALAVGHGVRMAEAGATVIDLGAESTRPGGLGIDPAIEWSRVAPVLAAFRDRWPSGSGPLLSVDTRHAPTALRAIDAGADWINDVTGFDDPAMIEAVSTALVDLVVMHHVGVPPAPGQTLDRSADPVLGLLRWGADRLERLDRAGINPSRVIFDPGIGFGKTGEQTAAVLARIGEFRRLGVRLLVGHSRKSFLKSWFAPEGVGPCATVADREIETMALTQHLATWAVDYVRVHDVEANARVLRAGAKVGLGARYSALGTRYSVLGARRSAGRWVQ